MRVPLAVQSVSEDKRMQHYPKKYRKQPAKRGEMSGRAFAEGN